MTQHAPMSAQQLEWISDQVEHTSHKVLGKYLRRSLAAYIALLLALVVWVQFSQHQLKEGLMGSCDRVNVLRAQSNGSDLVSFRILSISGQREQALANASRGKERETHQRSATALFQEAANLNITQLTDCDKAVGDPSHFHTPIAGPIGDPTKGKAGTLYPGVREIANESIAYLRRGH